MAECRILKVDKTSLGEDGSQGQAVMVHLEVEGKEQMVMFTEGDTVEFEVGADGRPTIKASLPSFEVVNKEKTEVPAL